MLDINRIVLTEEEIKEARGDKRSCYCQVTACDNAISLATVKKVMGEVISDLNAIDEAAGDVRVFARQVCELIVGYEQALKATVGK